MALICRRTLIKAFTTAVLPRAAFGQATAHRAPKRIAEGAVTHEWTSFLGPTYNGVSTETHLSRKLPPPLVWEVPTGNGYASPAVIRDRLVYIHRVGEEEIVECLHPETGATHWRLRYGSQYQDRYGITMGLVRARLLILLVARSIPLVLKANCMRSRCRAGVSFGGRICGLITVCRRNSLGRLRVQ